MRAQNILDVSTYPRLQSSGNAWCWQQLRFHLGLQPRAREAFPPIRRGRRYFAPLARASFQASITRERCLHINVKVWTASGHIPYTHPPASACCYYKSLPRIQTTVGPGIRFLCCILVCGILRKPVDRSDVHRIVPEKLSLLYSMKDFAGR